MANYVAREGFGGFGHSQMKLSRSDSVHSQNSSTVPSIFQRAIKTDDDYEDRPPSATEERYRARDKEEFRGFFKTSICFEYEKLAGRNADKASIASDRCNTSYDPFRRLNNEGIIDSFCRARRFGSGRKLAGRSTAKANIDADSDPFRRSNDEGIIGSFRRTRRFGSGKNAHQQRDVEIMKPGTHTSDEEGNPEQSLEGGIMRSGAYRGVTLRVSPFGVYAWPMDPKATSVIFLGNKVLVEKERPQVADWIQYRIVDGVVQDCRRIESEVLTIIKNNNVWIRTEVSNIAKAYSVNSGRYHYVGYSSLVGKVGFYNMAQEIDEKKTFDLWIRRSDEKKDKSQMPGVFWRYEKEGSGSLGGERKRLPDLDDSENWIVTSANDFLPCAQTAIFPPASQAKLRSAEPKMVPVGETSCGLVIHKRNRLGYVWSSDYEEGMIMDSTAFEIGDWVSFVTGPINTPGSSKYVAHEVKRIEPLYHATAATFSVAVEVPARVFSNNNKLIVYAEWFGEIDARRYASRNGELNLNDRFIARIERRKRLNENTVVWVLAGLVSPLDDELIVKPSLGCKNYESKVLRFLFEDERIRRAICEYDPDLATSIGKLFGIPPDF